MKAKDIERISKALGDPTRLRILQEVRQREWMQCSDICGLIDLAQPSVSHHLKQLSDSGLLISEKEGRNLKFSIDNDILNDYITFLGSLKL